MSKFICYLTKTHFYDNIVLVSGNQGEKRGSKKHLIPLSYNHHRYKKSKKNSSQILLRFSSKPGNMSSTDTNYNKKNTKSKTIRPSVAYPQLIPLLAKISILVQELHKIVTTANLADVLDVKQQTFDYHVQKEKGGKGK